MSRVVLDGSGVVVLLAATPEYLADAEAWRASKCSEHPSVEWRRFPTTNGGVQIRRQCLDCGYVLGGARRQTPEDKHLAVVDPDHFDRYEAERLSAWRAMEQKHARLQYERENSFFKEYGEYLNSEQWKAKRRLVFKRAGNMCEGCGLKPAKEVHHRTYAHRMNEFLFELVAVCTECHARLHADVVDAEEMFEPEANDVDDDYFEEPCCGCRWAGDRDGQYWCEREDEAAEFALGDHGACGPGKALFSELK